MKIKGYLVVLETPEEHKTTMPAYKGIFRSPTWPPRQDEEREALDKYVFDPYFKDKDSLIPTADKAMELLGLFESSPRSFEVIYCEGEPPESVESDEAEDHDTPIPMEFIGYDVAPSGGEFWSIVSELNEGTPFRGDLNANGLFDSRKRAVAFLQYYRDEGRPDCEMPFAIWRIWRVRPNCA